MHACLRKTEAINAFNLMIELHDNGKMNEYYNKELKTLEHFKYPNLFFRNTKNVFISMIPEGMIMRIAQSDSVTYEMIRKRLHRKGLGVKISGLRDFYATFMVRHGLIKEEVDLLQGRITQVYLCKTLLESSNKGIETESIQSSTGT